MGLVGIKDTVIDRIEFIIVVTLQVLIIALTSVDTIVLFVIFISNLITDTARISSIPDLLTAMQTSFAGVLSVVLGLELLETLRTYFVEHRVRLEVILVVAIIAVGRHVIQVDFGHASGSVLLGLSAVILSLTVGYALVRRAHSQPRSVAEPGKQAEQKVRGNEKVEMPL
jgi:uncharacterized membrane protein (DUF373 family)